MSENNSKKDQTEDKKQGEGVETLNQDTKLDPTNVDSKAKINENENSVQDIPAQKADEKEEKSDSMKNNS